MCSQNTFSSAVSARWVCRRTPFSSARRAVSRMISRVTENGEQGARAIRTNAPFPRLVEGVDHPLAVGEDGLGVLDHGRGRQAAVLDRQVHGPARQRHPHPHVPGGRGLDVHGVFEPLREDVVVVRRGRASGEQQLGQREPRRNVELIRRQPRPDRIEGLEPVEQLLAEGGAAGARQRLVEVVMRVDQSRQHDVPGGVEGVIAGRGGRGAGDQAFGDAVSLDDEAARRLVTGQDGQRVPDPDPHRIPVLTVSRSSPYLGTQHISGLNISRPSPYPRPRRSPALAVSARGRTRRAARRQARRDRRPMPRRHGVFRYRRICVRLARTERPMPCRHGASRYRSWCRSHSMLKRKPSSSRPLGTTSSRW